MSEPMDLEAIKVRVLTAHNEFAHVYAQHDKDYPGLLMSSPAQQMIRDAHTLITELEATREQLAAANERAAEMQSTREADLSVLAMLREQLAAANAQIAAKDAALRRAQDSYRRRCAKTTEELYTLETPYDHALSPDAGAGWLSPEEAERLRGQVATLEEFRVEVLNWGWSTTVDDREHQGLIAAKRRFYTLAKDAALSETPATPEPRKCTGTLDDCLRCSDSPECYKGLRSGPAAPEKEDGETIAHAAVHKTYIPAEGQLSIGAEGAAPAPVTGTLLDNMTQDQRNWLVAAMNAYRPTKPDPRDTEITRLRDLIERALRTMSADPDADIPWDNIEEVFMSYIDALDMKAHGGVNGK